MTDVNYDNIERYLSGSMTDKERHHFEAELDENEDLAQELHFYMYVNQSISECLYHTPIEELSFGKAKNKRYQDMNRLKWMALTAIGVIFVTILLWSPWKIYREIDASSVQMGTVNAEGLPVGNKYADIIELFNAGKYEEALPLLNGALTEQPNDLYIRYYRGLTFLNLKYLGSARRDLLKIYTENAPQMYDAAYYIALSYLEEEDDYKESARNWLDKIPQEAPIHSKAEALRKLL
ncbi:MULTISPECIES: tetratricopeptide repeat protein [Olivibacter]|jgi:tetratricopeptide (TPR) repeat protein|uniref:Tetratricopeptide repeat protein n=3 Tax=Sphingobacteriaceae TaxID=84566 RepID=F4C9W6_SPHS2|nr:MULTISPECIES: hypothetical protein [Olivibacter]MCL4641264.1 hypothetical protein [Olivibacter sp. UJ_SKK_5.1]MDM8177986.1 hypothetical protein [Olivibacter sp. 47]MDX3916495.1 hypothetical protein [Pseudosphingobacterium sp.]QEK99290.1 hypothetical protein FKG96_00275 [Olivibacter sp. LS-1]